MNRFLLSLIIISTLSINIIGQTAQVSVPFEIYDNGNSGGGYKQLNFGLDQSASDTIDVQLGESDLPPFPPAGAFEARFILPKNNFIGTLSSYLDYRYVGSFPYTDSVVCRLKYQAKDGADTMFFAWNFPAEVTGRMQDIVTGTIVNVFMSGEGVYGITNFDAVNQMKLTIYYDNILPVELSSFTATSTGNEIILNWITASETNNRGFDVERSQTSDVKGETINEWETIGFVEGNGTTTETKSYLFTDKNLSSGLYTYRLKQIDFDGTYYYSKEVEAEVGVLEEYSLEQNYPNPFNPSTKIKYVIPEESLVTIKVYDILGSEVMTLLNEVKQAGSHELEFNGEGLSSGLYFYRMESGSFTSTKKFMFMK